MADAPKKTFAEKLQSISKPTLFLILILVTTVPLFIPGTVPNEPERPAIALFEAVKNIPEGSTVLIESDWTNSTRGESRGQFKALIRMLARKKVKACIYTAADPQAPKVARDTLRSLNQEMRAKGQPTYNEWTDWIHVGFFPSAEGFNATLSADLRKAFAGRKSLSPAGGQVDAFKSPVLANVRSLKDVPALVLITASKTSDIIVERLSGQVPLLFMVTGVMGPENQVYFDSKQLSGLSKGLKGVYDLENLMNKDPDFNGMVTLDQGSLYYPTLHAALILMIVMVIIGNLGMALGRRQGK